MYVYIYRYIYIFFVGAKITSYEVKTASQAEKRIP